MSIPVLHYCTGRTATTQHRTDGHPRPAQQTNRHNERDHHTTMETFTVNILGCGSAKPTPRHMPTSQIVDFRSKYFMIDCGEGTQVQMQRMGLSMARVGHIFISHNHGDHVFGLPGLISTMALLGRTATLYVHGPAEVEQFLQCILDTYCEGINFEVKFCPVDPTQYQLIHDERALSVWSLPLKHRIPCCGYLFREKPSLPHIRREMIDAFDIPVSQINNIKAGASWTLPDGTVIPHEQLTTPTPPPRSYAYCSDTCYLPQLADLVRGVDLLYHEATYPDEFELRATQTCHSTARQAGRLAREAEVHQLVIGHFSARILNEKALLREAKQEFPETDLAREGMIVDVRRKDFVIQGNRG